MKYRNLVFFLFFLPLVGCQAQPTSNGILAPASPPSASAASPSSMKDLHWQLRDLLKMQLPATRPDARNGKAFKKSYSFDYSWSELDSTYIIELPEKQHDTLTEAVFGGSKYFLQLKNVAVEDVRIVVSDDQKLTSITIPAKPGRSFLYHPYGSFPDEEVASITIGWYDRVQDRTLARGLALLRQFLEAGMAGKQ